MDKRISMDKISNILNKSTDIVISYEYVSNDENVTEAIATALHEYFRDYNNPDYGNSDILLNWSSSDNVTVYVWPLKCKTKLPHFLDNWRNFQEWCNSKAKEVLKRYVFDDETGE